MFLLYYGRLQTRQCSSAAALLLKATPVRLIRTCSRNNNSAKGSGDDDGRSGGDSQNNTIQNDLDKNRQKADGGQSEKRRKRIEMLGLSPFKFVAKAGDAAKKATQTIPTPVSQQPAAKKAAAGKMVEPVFKETAASSTPTPDPQTAKASSQAKVNFDPEVSKKLAKLIDSKDPDKVVKMLETEPMKKFELFQAKINLNLEERVKQAQERQTSQREKELQEAEKAKKEKLRLEALKQEELRNKKIDEMKNTLQQEEQARQRARVNKSLKTPAYKQSEDGRNDSAYDQAHQLEGGSGLALFNKAELETAPRESPAWSDFYQKRFEHEVRLPHQNAFEEMIDLTNQGKLWHFPINNEQGIDESDANVPFFEHVFLEHHLEQFPDIEPIQEFMTLVLNGLSKNSFMSVAEKRDVIQWYKSYFDEKLDVIKESQELEKMEREGLELPPKTTKATTSKSKDEKASGKKVKEVKKN